MEVLPAWELSCYCCCYCSWHCLSCEDSPGSNSRKGSAQQPNGRGSLAPHSFLPSPAKICCWAQDCTCCEKNFPGWEEHHSICPPCPRCTAGCGDAPIARQGQCKAASAKVKIPKRGRILEPTHTQHPGLVPCLPHSSYATDGKCIGNDIGNVCLISRTSGL